MSPASSAVRSSSVSGKGAIAAAGSRLSASRNARSWSASRHSLLTAYVLIASIQPPGRIGVAVADLRRNEDRLAVADHAQHGDPVEQLAADIAGAGKPRTRRLLDQLADAGVLEVILHALAPLG